MTENYAFLTRLSRIAGATACDEDRTASAVALVHAYAAALHARLGIVPSRRPTAHAKEIGKQAFEGLRRDVLKAEIGAPSGSTCVFAAVRDCIDMARRVLALRMAQEERE